jgi:hypothetical protein
MKYCRSASAVCHVDCNKFVTTIITKISQQISVYALYFITKQPALIIIVSMEFVAKCWRLILVATDDCKVKTAVTQWQITQEISIYQQEIEKFGPSYVVVGKFISWNPSIVQTSALDPYRGKLSDFFLTTSYLSRFQCGHLWWHDKYPGDIQPLYTCLEACCGLLYPQCPLRGFLLLKIVFEVADEVIHITPSEEIQWG